MDVVVTASKTAGHHGVVGRADGAGGRSPRDQVYDGTLAALRTTPLRIEPGQRAELKFGIGLPSTVGQRHGGRLRQVLARGGRGTGPMKAGRRLRRTRARSAGSRCCARRASHGPVRAVGVSVVGRRLDVAVARAGRSHRRTSGCVRDVGEGDIVVFPRTGWPGGVAHRVSRVEPGDLLETKGDANPVADRDPVPIGALAGRVVARVPSGARGSAVARALGRWYTRIPIAQQAMTERRSAQ